MEGGGRRKWQNRIEKDSFFLSCVLFLAFLLLFNLLWYFKTRSIKFLIRFGLVFSNKVSFAKLLEWLMKQVWHFPRWWSVTRTTKAWVEKCSSTSSYNELISKNDAIARVRFPKTQDVKTAHVRCVNKSISRNYWGSYLDCISKEVVQQFLGCTLVEFCQWAKRFNSCCFSFTKTLEPSRGFVWTSFNRFSFSAFHQSQDEAYTLFFANSNWYYFVRLHAILCDRLRTIYERTQILASEEEKYKTTRRESAAIALRLKPQNEYEIPEYYPAFLEMLKSLLDGNMDATTYEDKLRDMYGIHAYIAFTLDRVSCDLKIMIPCFLLKRFYFRLFQTPSVNYSSVWQNATLLSVSSCIRLKVETTPPVVSVQQHINEPQQSWLISDEPSQVYMKKCTSRYLS